MTCYIKKLDGLSRVTFESCDCKKHVLNNESVFPFFKCSFLLEFLWCQSNECQCLVLRITNGGNLNLQLIGPLRARKGYLKTWGTLVVREGIGLQPD